MREPMSWALPLFRVAGIHVKVHVTYIVIVLSLFLKANYASNWEHWFDYLMVAVVMLFASILLHEFGHCLACRAVNGEADEILMGPLGGLAYCRPPHSVMAHFLTVAGGPAVNVVLCIVTGFALMLGGFVPPLNPLRSLSAYVPVLHNLQDGKYYSADGFPPPYVRVGTAREIVPVETFILPGRIEARTSFASSEWVEIEPLRTQPLPAWALWTARFFWLNLLLFCFNVFLPAYPMDGGRFLQALVWSRTDYERGTTVAAYVGMATGMAMIVVSMTLDQGLELIAIFVVYSSYVQLQKLAEPEGDGMYDTALGYRAFEDGEEAPPTRKIPRPGPLKRWFQARTARRIQREIEEQQADDARMDDLLAKLHREGKGALTPEEHRFMDRMAEKMRRKVE